MRFDFRKIMQSGGVALVFLLLLVFFLYKITYFNFYMFDEVYYADAAKEMYHQESDSNFQHPPLGKWLISLPFYVMGDSWSFSWRISSVVFGYSGLILIYFFGRKIGLEWRQSLIAVLCLVGSVSWYVLSRTAMLDIFLSTMVLLAGFVFYLFVSKNQFKRNYDKYKYSGYLAFTGICTGLAGLCKWSGFFLFLSYLFFFLFYVQGSTRRRMFHFLLIILVSIYTYFGISLAIYKFNYTDVAFRNFEDVIFHNSAMLPEKNPNGVKKLKLVGGYNAFLRYFLQNEVYIVSGKYMTNYGLVNNQLLAGLFLGFSLYFILSGIGIIIRKMQKISIELPIFFKERGMLLLYFYSFSMLFPWLLVQRVQYSFYYVPAFPFIILLTCFFLFKYCNWKLTALFLMAYFSYFIYWLPVSIPL